MKAVVFYGSVTLTPTWQDYNLSEYVKWAKTYLVEIQGTLSVASSSDVVSVKYYDGYNTFYFRVNRTGLLTLWVSSACIQDNILSVSSSVTGGVSKTLRIIATDENLTERYKYHAAVSAGMAGSNLTLWTANTPAIYYGRMGYRFNNTTANTATINITSSQGYCDQPTINIAASALTQGVSHFEGGLDASATFTATANVSTGFVHVTLWA